MKPEIDAAPLILVS